jgi:hypothetical protein
MMPEEGEPQSEETAEPLADEPSDSESAEPGDGTSRSRLGRLARRLLEPRELGEDARDLVGTFIETSDRAKSEVVRIAAREVRNYLSELRLKEDLLDLVTSHSLEVRLSVNLKPLEDALRATDEADESAEPEEPVEDEA